MGKRRIARSMIYQKDRPRAAQGKRVGGGYRY